MTSPRIVQGLSNSHGMWYRLRGQGRLLFPSLTNTMPRSRQRNRGKEHYGDNHLPR